MDFLLLLLLLTCCLLVVIRGTDGYQTYSVEQDCILSGVLNVKLSGAGHSSAALVRATEHTSYSLAMDCRLLLTAPDSHGIVVAVREIGFRTRFDGTCQDYIVIETPQCSHLFRQDEISYTSPGSTMTLSYHVSEDGIDNATMTGHPGFQITVTAYTKGTDCPNGTEWFRCHNERCVWSGLKCDSHNNCGDLSDELDCGTEDGSNSMVLIILAVLIVLLLTIMCIATLLCSKNETVRRFSTTLRRHTLSYLPKFGRRRSGSAARQ